MGRMEGMPQLAHRPRRVGGLPVGTATGFLLAILFTLVTALGGLLPTAAAHPLQPARSLQPAQLARSLQPAGKRYGPAFSTMRHAVDTSAWPQQQDIWCGLAAMDAIINWKKPTVSQVSLAA